MKLIISIFINLTIRWGFTTHRSVPKPNFENHRSSELRFPRPIGFKNTICWTVILLKQINSCYCWVFECSIRWIHQSLFIHPRGNRKSLPLNVTFKFPVRLAKQRSKVAAGWLRWRRWCRCENSCPERNKP